MIHLQPIHRGCARRRPRTVGRLLQQLLRRGEIDEGRLDTGVPKICRQIRQMRLGINPVAIPGGHPIYRQGMTKIMDARTSTTWQGLQAGIPDHLDEQLADSDLGVASGCLYVPEQGRATIGGGAG
jgi:hypothetical protein